MKKISIIFIICIASLWSMPLSNNIVSTQNYNNNSRKYQKIIYISYSKTPKKIINTQIFPISIKYLITNQKYKTLTYKFDMPKGMNLINPIPLYSHDGIYTVNTFYLQDINQSKKLPRIIATALNQDDNTTYPRVAILSPKLINVITLNPPKNFSNVIAKNFQITDYKTTTYDNNSNIVLFFAKALQANLFDIHISNVRKQGIESANNSTAFSTVIYYAIINKDIQTFKFTYFNLLTQSYATISIPIVVINNLVSTQTNLSPTAKQYKLLKLIIATTILFILLILIIFKKRYLYIFLAILISIYIIYLIVPQKEICVKSKTGIKILPIPQGVVFELTTQKSYFKELNKHNGYIRIKLDNNKVGWIKNEDICSN